MVARTNLSVNVKPTLPVLLDLLLVIFCNPCTFVMREYKVRHYILCLKQALL